MTDWEEFVRVWQSSGSIKEVAVRLGRKPDTVRVYASRMRKKGIPLKKYQSQPGMDVPRLQQLARELQKG